MASAAVLLLLLLLILLGRGALAFSLVHLPLLPRSSIFSRCGMEIAGRPV